MVADSRLPILFVGAGNLGGALIAGWRRCGAIEASDMLLRDPHPGAHALAAAQAGARLNPPDDALAHITHSISYTTDLTPGVTKGETLGTITFTLNGKTIATVPAIALADSPPASFFTKLDRKLSKAL